MPSLNTGTRSSRREAAGDFDYDAGGGGYAVQRRTDPRVAALVHAALGPARTVLNVGAAGAGQSSGGHTGIWPRPDGNRTFFERTNSCSVSTAFSRPKPLPFTPPNGEPRNARRM